MARRKPWEVSDELWAVIEPLLPKHERRFRYPGRKRIDDRRRFKACCSSSTQVSWEFLPQELVLTDARGTPLRVSLTGGHRHDVTQLLPLIDSLGPVRGKRGRPRLKPRTSYADRGYDYDIYRRRLRERGITPKIARRGQPHGSGLGKVR